jgi:hypothetical protein
VKKWKFDTIKCGAKTGVKDKQDSEKGNVIPISTFYSSA